MRYKQNYVQYAEAIFFGRRPTSSFRRTNQTDCLNDLRSCNQYDMDDRAVHRQGAIFVSKQVVNPKSAAQGAIGELMRAGDKAIEYQHPICRTFWAVATGPASI